MIQPYTQNGTDRLATSPSHDRAVRGRRKQIRSYCEAVAREFRPQKIVLFGSYAYGQPTPDSDVDLLVVLPFRGNDVAKAIQIRSSFDAPFPMDLLVRKPAFIASRLKERDMFIELVMTQGHVMYESEHA
jgi:predicted nucleotidyltransferase